ncbi:MAG: 1-pyrroline-5-carboxylate dehydrogenase, partial [Demequina sp.]
ALDDPWIRAAAVADEHAWAECFSVGHDPTGLDCEANVLRYLPTAAAIRWDGIDPGALARVCAAMMRAGGPGRVSSPVALPAALAEALGAGGVAVYVETSEDAVACMRAEGLSRVRYVGEVGPQWRGHADIAVFDGPVTAAPELEMLPFLREQAVSLTAHRYGTPFEPAQRIARDLRRAR